MEIDKNAFTYTPLNKAPVFWAAKKINDLIFTFIPTGEKQANKAVLAKDSAGYKSRHESDLHKTVEYSCARGGRRVAERDPEELDGEQGSCLTVSTELNMDWKGGDKWDNHTPTCCKMKQVHGWWCWTTWFSVQTEPKQSMRFWVKVGEKDTGKCMHLAWHMFWLSSVERRYIF